MRPKNLNPLIQVDERLDIDARHGDRAARGHDWTLHAAKSRQILLDDIDRYYAGADGVAFTPDGRYALVTHSEAATVSVIDTQIVNSGYAAFRQRNWRTAWILRAHIVDAPVANAIEPDGRARRSRRAFGLCRQSLGRQPDGGGHSPVPDSRSIDLGGPKEISNFATASRLFHDAKFCFQGQFACATCHPDNHIDGVAWNLETPQLGRDRVANRTLRGIAETAPYKWNGHNPDLETQCGPRIAKFLFHSEGFNAEQLSESGGVHQVHSPSAESPSCRGWPAEPAQERGRDIFFRKSCDTCHPPATHYTAKNKLRCRHGGEIRHLRGCSMCRNWIASTRSRRTCTTAKRVPLKKFGPFITQRTSTGSPPDMSKEQLNDLWNF